MGVSHGGGLAFRRPLKSPMTIGWNWSPGEGIPGTAGAQAPAVLADYLERAYAQNRIWILPSGDEQPAETERVSFFMSGRAKVMGPPGR